MLWQLPMNERLKKYTVVKHNPAGKINYSIDPDSTSSIKKFSSKYFYALSGFTANLLNKRAMQSLQEMYQIR